MRNEVKYFNDKSVDYRKEYDRVTPEGYSFRVRRDKVLAMVENGTRVVDIASGPGVMVNGLLDKGCTVLCIDAAPEMIARAKEEHHGKQKVDVQVGDAYELPIADGSFDIATAMGLIEYLEDEGTFLNETHRILRQGGALIVTFPNYASPWRAFNRIALTLRTKIKGAQKKEGAVTHREYTRSRATKLLEQHGFTVTEAHYYNFKLVPYPLDAKLPRLTVLQSRIFEYFDRTPLKVLGTGFILKAIRA